MDFLDLLLSHSRSLVYVGEVGVFYVPILKLDDKNFGTDGQTPRELFEAFLIDHFNAYTLEVSDTQGFWRQHRRSKIFRDKNARYEVSFRGQENLSDFVQFLSRMCQMMREEAIYLTMGQKSWLVLPQPALPE
ncbi:hypothetical protein [Thalassoroseus pseudoceratinae]|uniref:hypothetical protein n=1 Tax=Thalassoroseus pseudoceratinae TaxID=2713176 RepID=UPI0014241683|nr:hypothetical protein [Thalassoroseus pseudoceratinae]